MVLPSNSFFSFSRVNIFCISSGASKGFGPSPKRANIEVNAPLTPKILDWLSEQSYLRNLKLEGFEKNTLKQTAGQKIGQLEQVSITATVSGDLGQINKFISD